MTLPAFLQNGFVVALCHTLLHSLWQGLLLAIVTGLVLTATKNAAPSLRYRLLVGLFFGFTLIVAATFVREWLSIQPQQAPLAAAGHPMMIRITTHAEAESDAPLWQKLTDYFTTHAPLIVTIWFIFFTARFVQLLRGVASVQRIKNYKTNVPAEEWQQRLQSLIQRLGLRKPIRFLESGLIRVPAVMGTLKPVILVPAGMLSNLPADEVEAILLHELAHIQRNDYFVNLLQSLVEAILFFNPALLWLSAMIREEREHCCDDVALAITDDKTHFINALISFQEYGFIAAQPGMAFPGKKNQLLNRVKRILGNSNKTLNATEKSVLTLAIGALLLVAFAAASKMPDKPAFGSSHKAVAGNPFAPRRNDQPVKDTTTPRQDTAATTSRAATSTSTATTILTGKGTSTTTTTTTTTTFTSNQHSSLSTTSEANGLPTGNDTLVKPGSSQTGKNDVAMRLHVNDPFSSMSINAIAKNNIIHMTLTAKAKDGKRYEMRKTDEALTYFSVDGQVIDRSDYKNYQTVIDAMEASYLVWRTGSDKVTVYNYKITPDKFDPASSFAQSLNVPKPTFSANTFQFTTSSGKPDSVQVSNQSGTPLLQNWQSIKQTGHGRQSISVNGITVCADTIYVQGPFSLQADQPANRQTTTGRGYQRTTMDGVTLLADTIRFISRQTTGTIKNQRPPAMGNR